MGQDPQTMTLQELIEFIKYLKNVPEDEITSIPMNKEQLSIMKDVASQMRYVKGDQKIKELRLIPKKPISLVAVKKNFSLQ